VKRTAGRSAAPRAVDGVLLLDKPPGITSQAAVSRAKFLLGAARAGHTGTLDPMATGLLPLAFGEATKFSQGLLEADKSYHARLRLGLRTVTGDLEGEVIARAPVDVDRAQIEQALSRFRGPIRQVPPMFSALKHRGRPLYAYARAGVEIAREARQVSIHALELLDFREGEFTLEVSCSKGTYVRVLAEDIGRELGCGAALSALERTRVGPFTLADAVGLEELAALDRSGREARLLPVDALVMELARVDLDAGEAALILHGRAIERPLPPHGGSILRAYGPEARFLGLVQVHASGTLRPFRLVASRAAQPVCG
jgi:tRNA pseudouridine55 synthase